MCDKKYELVEEMAVSDKKSLNSHLANVYEHMLKFEYMVHVQGTSWVNSVNTSRKKLKAASKNELKLLNCEKAFISGINRCIEAGEEYEKQLGGYKTPFDKPLPDHMPEDYLIDNILDDNKISEFFEKYVSNSITLKELKNRGLIRKDAYPDMRQYPHDTYTTAQAKKGCMSKSHKEK